MLAECKDNIGYLALEEEFNEFQAYVLNTNKISQDTEIKLLKNPIRYKAYHLTWEVLSKEEKEKYEKTVEQNKKVVNFNKALTKA